VAGLPAAACDLVCLPHAGGGGAVFRDWQRHTDVLRVSAVLLPGRETRLREPAHTDVDALVEELLEPMRQVVTGQYALYGHSMGALVAFELTRRLRSAGLPMPLGLFLAGADAPQRLDPDPVHDLPRDELVAWLEDGHGLDPEALRYPELIDLMLPTVRADLALVETYRHVPQPPLDVPIRVFRGRGDPYCSTDGARDWALQTTAGCAVSDLDGDHFFVDDHLDRVVALIEADVTERSEGVR